MGAQRATERTIPDWLAPGAEVVLYSTGGGASGSRDTSRTTIKTVGKEWASVNDPREPRIRIETMQSAAQGGTWTRYTRHMAAADSDEGRAELDRAHRERLADVADHAVRTWQRERSPENRRAAIEALQAVEDAEARR